VADDELDVAVVRFNFMPKDAVSWATGLSGQVVVQDRGVNKASRSWYYYQVCLADLAFGDSCYIWMV
jgi:hypothetical protein